MGTLASFCLRTLTRLAPDPASHKLFTNCDANGQLHSDLLFHRTGVGVARWHLQGFSTPILMDPAQRRPGVPHVSVQQ